MLDTVPESYINTRTAPATGERSKFHTTKEQRKSIVQRFKNPDEYEGDLKILVVCDMLLTGFDEMTQVRRVP